MNATTRVVNDTGKFDRVLKTMLHDELHWLESGCPWEDWVQAWCDGIPVSARTGTSLPGRPPHPSLWCCSAPSLSTICQPGLSHCASLSTQHVWL